MPQNRFRGVDRLYGAGALKTLAERHVCVVGVGGVGSWAAEALARSGIGRLTLIDADEVCLSNTNRQSHALAGQYGRTKVDVLAERLRAINPTLALEPLAQFVTPKNLREVLDRGYDYVFDACDSFRVKVEMTGYCRRNKIPILVCGSAGGRTDPTRIQVRDLSRTEHDKLLGMVRKKLRDEFNFTRNPERYFGVQAVFSLENVRYPQPDGTVCATRPPMDAAHALKLDCGQGLGAVMHVTAAFAMAGVARIVERLLAAKPALRSAAAAPAAMEVPSRSEARG
jgi:tRNA A37 threonylcarbamoyladenosine dehydratase